MLASPCRFKPCVRGVRLRPLCLGLRMRGQQNSGPYTASAAVPTDTGCTRNRENSGGFGRCASLLKRRQTAARIEPTPGAPG